jgi:fibrillarin-like pre-rRNA processing protein
LERLELLNPEDSKFIAFLQKKKIFLDKNAKILYLGAATGTTVSIFSKIVPDGAIYAVEFSWKPMRQLVSLSEELDNVIPLFFDANRPDDYKKYVELVDFIYEDISQKNQIEIANKNAELFLKDDGLLLIMLKTKSIDSTKNPREIASKEIQKLDTKFNILDIIRLNPFYKDHVAIVARYNHKKE